MSTLKTANPHARAPETTTPPTPPTPQERPATVYRPDVWSLWFWLACAALLVLLHVIDWVSGALRALFGG